MWSISTRHIPYIDNFAKAEQVWAEAKPWKNENTSWRPLAERRATHKRIVRINDGDAYQLVLFQTPIVTYYVNGDIELQTHDTTSTSSFAWCVRPANICHHSVRGTMFWEYPSQEGPRFVRQGKSPLYLNYVGTSQYNLVTNPAEDYEWQLDRSKAATVRKLLSHYDKWEKMTSRLTGDRRYARHPYFWEVEALLANSEKLEDFPARYAVLGAVDNFRTTAYEAYGARTKVPVPHDRLPRKQR